MIIDAIVPSLCSVSSIGFTTIPPLTNEVFDEFNKRFQGMVDVVRFSLANQGDRSCLKVMGFSYPLDLTLFETIKEQLRDSFIKVDGANEERKNVAKQIVNSYSIITGLRILNEET